MMLLPSVEICRMTDHPANLLPCDRIELAGTFAPEQLEAIREDALSGAGCGCVAAVSPENSLFTARMGKALPSEAPCDDKHYRIVCRDGGLVLAAANFTAFYDGLRTVFQMLHTPCEECVIEDAPHVAVRALHIDLKGMTPKFDFLLSMLKSLSLLKINAFLLEYEDKFAYRSHPLIAHREMAFSGQEMKKLIDACHARNVTLIPKLQCFAHWEYILRHEKYAFLRDGIHANQIDPERSEEGFQLWREMADELLDLHGEDEYFHIGADEAAGLGERFPVFIRHVERCADYLRSHGKQVLIWDDMFRNHGTHECGALFEKCVLAVWQYKAINESFVDRALSIGGQVAAASSIRITALDRPDVDDQFMRIRNLNDWRAIIERKNLPIHLCTAWTRSHSLMPSEGMMPGLLLLAGSFAESAWSSRAVDLNEIASRFSVAFFGVDLGEALWALDRYPGEASAMLKEVEAVYHPELFKVLGLLAHLEEVRRYVDFCIQADAALYPTYTRGVVTEAIRNNFLDGVRISREKIDEISREWYSELAECYPKEVIREILERSFAFKLHLNEELEAIIRAARPV